MYSSEWRVDGKRGILFILIVMTLVLVLQKLGVLYMRCLSVYLAFKNVQAPLILLYLTKHDEKLNHQSAQASTIKPIILFLLLLTSFIPSSYYHTSLNTHPTHQSNVVIVKSTDNLSRFVSLFNEMRVEKKNGFYTRKSTFLRLLTSSLFIYLFFWLVVVIVIVDLLLFYIAKDSGVLSSLILTLLLPTI